MRILEIRAVAIFALKVFRSTVRASHMSFEIYRLIKLFATDFATDLWWLVVNEMFLHQTWRFENLCTHRARCQFSWVWYVSRNSMSLELVCISELPQAINAFVHAQAKVRIDVTL